MYSESLVKKINIKKSKEFRLVKMGTLALWKRGSDGLSIRARFLRLDDRVFFANKKCGFYTKIPTRIINLDEKSATTYI